MPIDTSAMGDMATIEVKAYVPARNFDESKQFYQELGFEVCTAVAMIAVAEDCAVKGSPLSGRA